jgi:hypothetical protein
VTKVLSILAVATVTATVLSAVSANAQSPVYLHVQESAVYTPPGALAAAQDPKNQGKQGVTRTCIITVANLTDREITVDLEYAMYKSSPKTGVTPMMLAGMSVPKPTGRNQKPPPPPTKLKETIVLGPRQSRQIKAEGWMPGEVGEGMRVKDLGQQVERSHHNYTYYANRNQYNNYNDYLRRYYNNARQTDAPAPAKPVEQTAIPIPEQYYGYSVAAFVGGQLVALSEKNPQRVPKFGVTAH